MHPLRKVSIKTGAVSSLNAQSPGSIYPYGFPFTLNCAMGCSFACKGCFSPIILRKNIQGKREHFFNESNIKLDISESLNSELSTLSGLPQHLKRVQISEHSEYYLPEVLRELKSYGRDTMLEVLEVFQNHWNNGNKWMLHILTKSHLILKHLDKLKELKEMVQVEISFSTPYEDELRKLELYTPSIKKRLETIETLSKEEIFVRIMSMPFFGGVPELDELKRITFNVGAQALKNKALNYYSWDDVKKASFDDLVNYRLPQTGSRRDSVISPAHMIKSGEDYLVNGNPILVNSLMPSAKAWSAMSKFEDRSTIKSISQIDMGYTLLNNIDWGYIK